MNQEKERKELAKQLVGWTIVDVPKCSRQDESLWGLTVEKDGQRKTIEIYATELGWWTNTPIPKGTHEWMHLDLEDGGKFSLCELCNIAKDNPKAAEPCVGETRYWGEDDE